MDINSFMEIPSRKRTRKKKLTFQNLTSIFILLICLTLLCVCSGKMFFKIYQHGRLKAEYNSIVKQNALLTETTTELSLAYTDKKSEYDEIQKKYDEAMANSPIAYLTFDDGPSDNTLKLLDVLDKYNVKATFFVVYKEGYDNVYREIVKRGHVLANHTYSHQYEDIYASPEAFIDNILKLDKKLEEITGVPPSKILRFPGGSNTGFVTPENSAKIKAKLEELGYVYFDWNVDSLDASAMTQPKDVVVNGVLNGADLVNTANVLMHDTNVKHTTIEAVPQIIEGLKDRGYRFKSLDHESVKIQF